MARSPASTAPVHVEASTPAQHAPSLGSARRWALDFALVGALSACFAIGAVDRAFDGVLGVQFIAVSAGAGALSGAVLGPTLRAMLAGRLGHTRIGMLLLLGVIAGFAWGATVGVAGASAMTPPYVDGSGWLLLGGAIAGVAGAIQFGWFWLPYTLRTARGRSTLPLVAAAAVLALGLGWLGLFAVMGCFMV